MKDENDKQDELTIPQFVFFLLFIAGFGYIASLFVFTMLYVSVATLAGGDGRSPDWERIWLGTIPIAAILSLVGTIGMVATFREEGDE